MGNIFGVLILGTLFYFAAVVAGIVLHVMQVPRRVKNINLAKGNTALFVSPTTDFARQQMKIVLCWLDRYCLVQQIS